MRWKSGMNIGMNGGFVSSWPILNLQAKLNVLIITDGSNLWLCGFGLSLYMTVITFTKLPYSILYKQLKRNWKIFVYHESCKWKKIQLREVSRKHLTTAKNVYVQGHHSNVFSFIVSKSLAFRKTSTFYH